MEKAPITVTVNMAFKDSLSLEFKYLRKIISAAGHYTLYIQKAKN
jgi:hypothetical protein